MATAAQHLQATTTLLLGYNDSVSPLAAFHSYLITIMSIRSRLFGPPAPKMPTGLIELMDGLARDVLKNNPDNIYEFCALHMHKLLQIRDGSAPKPLITLDQKIAIAQKKVRQRAAQRQRENNEKLSGNLRVETKEPLIACSPQNNAGSEYLEENDINVTDVEAKLNKNTIDTEETVENPTEPVPNELENSEKKEIQKTHNADASEEQQDNIVTAVESSHEDNKTENKPDIDVIQEDVIEKKEIRINDNADTQQEVFVTAEQQENKVYNADHKQDVDDIENGMIEKKILQTINNEVNAEGLDIAINAEENDNKDGDTEQKQDIGQSIDNVDQKQDIDVAGEKKNDNPTELIPTKVDLECSNNEIVLNTYVDKGVNQADEAEKALEDFTEIESYERSGIKHVINAEDICVCNQEVDIIENKISGETDVVEIESLANESLTKKILIETTEDTNKSIGNGDSNKIVNDSETNQLDDIKNETNCINAKQDQDVLKIEKVDVTLDSDSHSVNNEKAKTQINEPVNDSLHSSDSNYNNESTNNVTSNKTVDFDKPDELEDRKNLEIILDSENSNIIPVENNETHSVQPNELDSDLDTIGASESQGKEVTQKTEENLDTESALEPTHDKTNNINSSMDLETAAVTIQKVFRSFLFKTKSASYDDSTTVDISLLTQDKEKEESEVSNVKDRRTLGISRMDTVLQTVNEEKSLSLSTDDSSTLSSAATIIQAHVRGFLVRNKYNLHKTISSNSLIDSDAPSIPSLEADSDNWKSKTVLNIHIVPEGGHFVSRDESILTSMDLSLDSSPPSSVNLHPLGYDKSERRKQLKREDAIQSVSPPSNNSGKLSEDHDSVKEVLTADNSIGQVTNEKSLIETQELVTKAEDIIFKQESDEKTIDLASDELDVITPFVDDRSSRDSDNTSKLLHSGEFHDIVVPTKVTRSDTSVVRDFQNVLVYFILWNN